MKPIISYDQSGQVLSVQLNKNKSVDSEVQENVVLDYDQNGKLVRINFYRFSFENFKRYAPKFGPVQKV